jgi:hypothetical protein
MEGQAIAGELREEANTAEIKTEEDRDRVFQQLVQHEEQLRRYVGGVTAEAGVTTPEPGKKIGTGITILLVVFALVFDIIDILGAAGVTIPATTTISVLNFFYQALIFVYLGAFAKRNMKANTAATKNILKKIAVRLFGTGAIEIIPILDFLPFGTFGVWDSIHQTNKEYKRTVTAQLQAADEKLEQISRYMKEGEQKLRRVGSSLGKLQRVVA